MTDRLFDPLIASTCAGDPSQIIARYAFPALVNHESRSGSTLQGSARERIEARRRRKGRATGSWSCAEGMQQLPQRLAGAIDTVRTATTIDAITTRDGRATLSIAGGGAEQFDAAVIAVPAPALGRMTIDLPGAATLASIGSMPHASIGVVSLGFRSVQVGQSLAASRLLVPSVEHRAILSAVFPSALFAGRAPDGHELITVFVGGARRPELLDLDEDALVAMVVDELRALLDVTGDPVVREVTIWRSALPQAVAGHGERLAAADAVEGTTPQLAFAGSWRDGLAVGEVLLGECVRRSAWWSVSPALRSAESSRSYPDDLPCRATHAIAFRRAMVVDARRPRDRSRRPSRYG